MIYKGLTQIGKGFVQLGAAMVVIRQRLGIVGTMVILVTSGYVATSEVLVRTGHMQLGFYLHQTVAALYQGYQWLMRQLLSGMNFHANVTNSKEKDPLAFLTNGSIDQGRIAVVAIAAIIVLMIPELVHIGHLRCKTKQPIEMASVIRIYVAVAVIFIIVSVMAVVTS